MTGTAPQHYADLWDTTGEVRYQALLRILDITEKEVDWAYAVWDDLVARLVDKDNHHRAIAAQVLSNLALSDPQGRMLADFPALLAVTRDARFVTARHCLQAIWKVGRGGEKQRELVMDGLTARFLECADEKNCTLVRSDIIQAFKRMHREVQDDVLAARALELIAQEENLKYRHKYMSIWRAK